MRVRATICASALLALSPAVSACAASEQPTEEEVTVEDARSDGTAGECDPNYTGCVPDVPYDLDCADISHSVEVIGGDPHGFDGDGDGYGCETYG